MEVIEFRGKDIGTNKWIYGGYFKHLNRTLSPIGDRITKKDIDHLIITGSYSDWNMPRGIDCFAVKEETVGQFTGLYDSKGDKIYNGDILEITGNHKPGKYIVVWDKYRVAWWGKNIKYDKREREHDDDWFQLLGSIFQSLVREVIGNGIDNPELLEV